MNETRTIFVPSVDALGGVERLLLTLTRFLHESGIPARILCYRQTGSLQDHATWPIHVEELRPTGNYISEMLSLRHATRDAGRQHAVLAFDLKAAFYWAHLRRPLVLHLTDPPSLLPRDVSKNAFSISGGHAAFPVRVRGELAHRLNRRGVRRAQKVIAMTERIADEIHALYGVRATVLRPGIDSLGAHPARSLTETARFLTVSRLEATKRVDLMIEALVRWAAASVNPREWRMDIVGDGPDRERLETMVRRLGLSDRVTFHGHLGDEAFENLFSRSHVFLMAAVQGYGLPALEALDRGLALVVHGDSGVTEILAGSPWVEIVRSAGPSGFSEAIGRIIDRLAAGALDTASRPHIPTGESWARQICVAAGWLPETASGSS